MDVTIAKIGAAHALRGEVWLELRTDSPEQRLYPSACLRTDRADGILLTVTSVREQKGRLVVKFDGVDDRNAAESLRGVSLIADSEDLPAEDDAWYPHQLRGLRALDGNGNPLGEVINLVIGAAQDLLIVRTEGDDGREVMVPFVKQIVTVVDVEAGHVVIEAPGGLFTGEAQE